MKNENSNTENVAVENVAKVKATKTRKPRTKKSEAIQETNQEVTENVEVTASVANQEVAEVKETKQRKTSLDKQIELEQSICQQWNISEVELLRYALKHKKQSQKPVEFFEKLIVNLVQGKASFENA